MNEFTAFFLFAGVPIVICLAVGAWHGRRLNATRPTLLLGALAVSALTSWSVWVGGADGTDMNFTLILPSWFLTPYAALVAQGRLIPPGWFSPWVEFASYLIAAHIVRRRAGRT